MFKKFLNKKSLLFNFIARKQLIDLPLEIWIEIFRLVPIEELKNFWSQEVVLNSKLAYAIGYLLINHDIHIYKISSRYWSYFEPPVMKTTLAAKDCFNILRLGKRNRFGFAPKSLTIVFFLFTIKCFTKLKNILKFFHDCLDIRSINSELVLVFGNVRLSKLQLDFVKSFRNVYQLKLYKEYSNIRLRRYLNIVDLILEVDNHVNISSYPKQLKYLRISPKPTENKIAIKLSLEALPNNLVYLRIDGSMNLLDNGKELPHLKYLECRGTQLKNCQKLNQFIITNRRSLKYIHLEYNSLKGYYFNSFEELRSLSLVKCSDINFSKFFELQKLERLSLTGCDISNINEMNFPPNLKEIFISPGNNDILYGLNIPVSLKSITIIDIDHIP